ncbi:hypothetical protein ABMB68_003948 [Bradyrhizobium sp. RT4a]|uniref:hypothetical protein n=1 Tax=Bradyrhizobium sp. RT4a TaxID=3158556 RepID=UPI00339B8AE1
MTLTLSQVDHGDLCHGWSWAVQDEEKLAQQVASVALGQFRHVSKILAGVDPDDPPATRDHAADAIELLTVPDGEDPWHRDGWIFQTISWIAAHQQSHGAVTRPPHIIKAHKGFDGLQLRLTEDGKSVAAVIIFEDKATENPRKTIREDVWPGIMALESGKRVNQLTHDVSAALETQKRFDPELDIDAAISNILWKDARRYRVSITVGETHKVEQARKRLFKGFDESAPGGVDRRRAETIHIPDLRQWMQQFAIRVIAHVNTTVTDV